MHQTVEQKCSGTTKEFRKLVQGAQKLILQKREEVSAELGKTEPGHEGYASILPAEKAAFEEAIMLFQGYRASG